MENEGRAGAATAMGGFGATTTVSGNKISTASTITTTPGALTVLNLSGGINLNNANLIVKGGGYLVTAICRTEGRRR